MYVKVDFFLFFYLFYKNLIGIITIFEITSAIGNEMAIEFKKNFYTKFSREDLGTIKNFRLGSIFLTIVVIIINFVVFLSVTFLGFTYWGNEGYFFLYSVWLNIINISYYFTFTAMWISFICVLSHVYLLKFTINFHIEILRGRKDEDQVNLKQEITNFKKAISLRILGQFSLIGTMFVHLNYYPQNVRLFYPYIGCDALTDTCVISSNIVNSFVMAMTGFLILIIILGMTLILVNLKEVGTIRMILDPVLAQRKLEKEKKRQDELKAYRKLSIDERRQVRIQEIRDIRQKREENRRDKHDKKFQTMMDKEQFGKKGYKRLKKTDDVEEKKKQEKKPKKDEFDFT